MGGVASPAVGLEKWHGFAGRRVVACLALWAVLLALPPLLGSDALLQTINLAFIYGIAALGLNIIFGLSGLLSIAQAAVMGVGAYALAFAMAASLGILPSVALAC